MKKCRLIILMLLLIAVAGILFSGQYAGRLNSELSEAGCAELPEDEASVMEAKLTGQTLGILTLIPPLLAVGLAFLVRDVVISLLTGFVSGVALLMTVRQPGNGVFSVLADAFDTSCRTVLNVMSDPENCGVIIMCFVIGGMIAVISRTGGFAGLAQALTRRINTPKKAGLIGELLGILVFFDDYAHSLFVGPVMRPNTDRLGVSREKLAFIVNSTAAPVTGIAPISSWIAVEVAVIEAGFSAAGITGSGYTTYLSSIPYCFYSIFCLVFVLLNTLMEREYGPMLKAEIRARGGQPLRPGANLNVREENPPAEESGCAKSGNNLWVAVLPISALCVFSLVSFYIQGRSAAIASGALSADAKLCWNTITVAYGSADTILLVLEASVIGSVIAIVMGCAHRCFTLIEAARTWISGAEQLFITAVILCLAWSLSAIMGKLGTTYFIVNLITANLPFWLVPSLIFLTCCIISFAAGSYGCMFIVMPMAIPIAYSLVKATPAMPNPDTFISVCIASVLSGSIFGDHCSPIADCTILSAMGSGCESISLAKAQIPYALTIAVISALFGTLPAGIGISAWISLPAGFTACAAALLIFGRNPDRELLKRKAVKTDRRDSGGPYERNPS